MRARRIAKLSYSVVRPYGIAGNIEEIGAASEAWRRALGGDCRDFPGHASDSRMLQAGDAILEHGPQNYAAPNAELVALVSFERAYLLLFPWSKSPRHDLASWPGRDAATQAMFGHRAKIETVRAWRKGHRNPPQWARDLLASHLEREAHERLKAAAALRANEKGGQ